MKGHSSGAPATSRHHKHHQQHQHHHHHHHHYSSSTRVDKYRPARTISRDSSTSQDSHKDPQQQQQQQQQQQHHSDYHRHNRGRSRTGTGTGRGSETIGFIPGSADGGGPAGRHTCGACSSLGWSSCKAFICCLLTCGFYGSREPCLPVTAGGAESSTDHPPKAGAESRPLRGGGVTAADGQPGRQSKLPASDSFRYQDVRIAGQTVVYPVTSSRGSRTPGRAGGGDTRRPVSGASLLSLDDDREEEEQLSDVDSLISKKLLELYALHQIDQLARCTSDSSFSRKTNEISELIYSVAQDLNLQEREAECRLVHGVIRISTRKNQKNRSLQPGRRPTTTTTTGGRCDGTLPPDSGNETMTFISSDFPEVKVSEQTPSDELARKMRHHSGRTFSSSTTTAYSAYHHETETDSSGAPLLL